MAPAKAEKTEVAPQQEPKKRCKHKIPKSIIVVRSDAQLAQFENSLISDEAARAEAGLINYLVAQEKSSGGPGRLVAMLEFDCLASLTEFVDSPAAKAFVDTTSPDSSIWKTKNVMSFFPGTFAPGWFSLITSFKVEDFSAWKSNFMAQREALHKSGIIGDAIRRSQDDDQFVIVHLIAPDAAPLEALTTHPKFSKLLFAGPLGVPKNPLVVQHVLNPDYKQK